MVCDDNRLLPEDPMADLGHYKDDRQKLQVDHRIMFFCVSRGSREECHWSFSAVGLDLNNHASDPLQARIRKQKEVFLQAGKGHNEV